MDGKCSIPSPEKVLQAVGWSNKQAIAMAMMVQHVYHKKRNMPKPPQRYQLTEIQL